MSFCSGRARLRHRSPFAAPALFPMLLSSLAPISTLLIALAPLAKGDALTLEDGRVLEGFLVEDTSTHILFQVLGESEARKFSHRDVIELSLTFPSQAARIAADPRWSEERVQAAIERYFLPEEHEDIEIVRSKHYIIFSTASGADRMKKAMEEIYEAFAETFPFEEPEGASLLPVYLLADHDQYTEWSMRATGWDRAQAAGTAGHASGPYFATYYTGGADATMYHEAGHQLVGNRLHLNGGGSWFQEGMAVYFEDKWKKSHGLSSVASGMIKSDRYTPFRELFEVRSLLHSTGDDSRENKSRQRYTQAGTIIHFLAEGDLSPKFGDMLEELRTYRGRGARGRTTTDETMWDRIFRRAYGLDVDGVEAAWKKGFLGR